MNPDLDALKPYPFERLAALKAGVTPPAELKHVPLTIGEPQHAPFAAALATLQAHLPEMARYPATAGMPELRNAIAGWASRRFGLTGLDPEHQVLPVNGTREAIFAFVQAALDRTRPARVAVPNPFYQIYEAPPYSPAASRSTSTAAPRTTFARTSTPYQPIPGGRSSSSSSARRATPPAR
ncbi:hypothetical protein Q427_03275 [Halomonas sp. BC04]|nr:hypothetical protein Q427_03275 [Halomonas sp. BC04]